MSTDPHRDHALQDDTQRSGSISRRRRPDRGLPNDGALRELARTYLQTQRSLWPDLVANGTLPEADDDVMASMAEQFRRRFLASDVETIEPSGSKQPWEAL